MKGIDKKTIWERPKYLPYLQPVLTDDMVLAAEKKIGYKLPIEYLELLNIQNGGYIRFTIKDTSHSQIYGIGPFYPSITSFEWLKDSEGTLSFKLDGLFPFDSDGHWSICLDYRKNKLEPEITSIDTESDFEKPVAISFKEYLDLIEIETNDELVIDSVLSIEESLKLISIYANIKFEEPDCFSHGYPIYRSKINESWIWISSNKVPSGFIRKGEDRYDELKSQMEISSIRHPEVSENALLITISDDDTRKLIIDKLTTKGLMIRQLKDYL